MKIKCFRVGIVNLKNDKTTFLTLPYICTPPDKFFCVDNVTFKNGYAEITTNLRKSFNHENYFKEKYIVYY